MKVCLHSVKQSSVKLHFWRILRVIKISHKGKSDENENKTCFWRIFKSYNILAILNTRKTKLRFLTFWNPWKSLFSSRILLKSLECFTFRIFPNVRNFLNFLFWSDVAVDTLNSQYFDQAVNKLICEISGIFCNIKTNTNSNIQNILFTKSIFVVILKISFCFLVTLCPQTFLKT